jgi:hypothetical protein
MIACNERFPMLPVVHWITLSGRSAEFMRDPASLLA